MKKIQLVLLLVSTFSLWQCANPVRPTGGPKDEIAPQIIKSESTPNGLTNYTPQETEFTFDEFIVLRNPARNIIISPPVDPKPEFYLSGKTVVIDWTEVDSLRSNTTYTVNFANAVEDLNEGNPLTDFTFAFSTGPTLDSLTWKVKVIDKTGSAQKNITVMLYDEFRDSVVRNQLPYYFAKTDANGIATFNFLREGVYKVFALKDDNLTLTYDLPNEAIGFLKEAIVLPSDTSSMEEILLFTPPPKVILSERPFYQGNKIVFLFTPLDTSIRLQALDKDKFHAQRWKSDSLIFWPKQEVNDSLRFNWLKDEGTETYTIASKDTFIKTAPKPLYNELTFIGKTSMIEWNKPVKRPDDSTFFRLDTNGNKLFLKITSHSPLKTKVKLPSNNWPEQGKIRVLPQELQSQYGGHNRDTIMLNYFLVQEEDLGNLELSFTNADVDTAIIVKLVQAGRAIRQQYFQNDTSYSWFIDNLQPGNYLLQLIVDENKNGKQDGGNYWGQQHPELPVEYKLPKLRANWTLEEEINIKNAIKGR